VLDDQRRAAQRLGDGVRRRTGYGPLARRHERLRCGIMGKP
jgi:hypothetical protein